MKKNFFYKNFFFKIFSIFSSILENCVLLTAAQYVQSHLDWYLLHNLINKPAAQHLQFQIKELIKNLGKHSLKICEGFGIPEHVIHAPIYTGYQKYYSVDITNGEHYENKEHNELMRVKF
jgi:hypothetical protein